MRWLLIAIVFLCSVNLPAAPQDSFITNQQRFARVAAAFQHCDTTVQRKLKQLGVTGAPQLLFRVFKQEMLFQVFVKNQSGRYVRYDNFKICAASGKPGPKRRQGDKQIPEGFYEVKVFNPESKFLLSLGLNYPNAADSVKSKALDKGGDIYIHGECSSIGCIALDTRIEEVYVLAVMARNGGYALPVHIFPFRMSEKNFVNYVDEKNRHLKFWRNLQQGFLYFEEKKRLPEIAVDSKGNYQFR